MATPLQVAEYFLAVSPEPDITHMKLQKLCAYAQAINLAFSGKPLFSEDIEAWTHGPVIPSLYQEYKTYGNAIIPASVSEEKAIQAFSQAERYILQMVWATYGRFTAWALRNQSHWDFPGDFDSRGDIISQSDIKSAFSDNPLVKRMRANEAISDAAYALEV